MLRLTHVTLKTRQVILQDVDFTFEKGRIYGILAINVLERRPCSEL